MFMFPIFFMLWSPWFKVTNVLFSSGKTHLVILFFSCSFFGGSNWHVCICGALSRGAYGLHGSTFSVLTKRQGVFTGVRFHIQQQEEPSVWELQVGSRSTCTLKMMQPMSQLKCTSRLNVSVLWKQHGLSQQQPDSCQLSLILIFSGNQSHLVLAGSWVKYWIDKKTKNKIKHILPNTNNQ